MINSDYIKAALAFLGVAVASKAVAPVPDYRGQPLPLSLRNNNPGALLYSGKGDNWQGRVKSTEPGVYRFKNMAYGTRAMIIVLRSYYFSHGLRTLNDIFNRYAPYGHGTNNPAAYAMTIANEMGITPNERIDWNKSTVKALVYGITGVESGKNADKYLPVTTFEKAYLMA